MIKRLAAFGVICILVITFYSNDINAKYVKYEKELTEYSKLPILIEAARQLAVEAMNNEDLHEYLFIIRGMLAMFEREIELEKILDIKIDGLKEAKRLIIIDLILQNIDITLQLIELEKMESNQYNL